MTRDVIVVPPDLSIADAWQTMVSENIRHLPVVRDNRLVGIVSDRDLLRAGHLLGGGVLAFWEQTVAEVMTKNPIVCPPSASVGFAARTMTEKKIDALPIVNGERLVGLITSTDLLMLLHERPDEEELPFEFQVEERSRAA